MSLTNNQKKFLRKLAHNINPMLMIGQNGLTNTVLLELQVTLKKHEILKIKMQVEKADKQQIIQNILQASTAELIQVIGNIFVIYRPFNQNPQLILPKK